MHETKIVASLITSREAYDKIAPLIQVNTFSDIGREVYKEVKEFYEKDLKAEQVDLDIIRAKLEKRYGKRYPLFHEYVEGLPSGVSIPNLLDVFVSHRKETIGLEIAQALALNNEKKAKELMNEYLALEVVEDERKQVFNATPLEELEHGLTGKNLIPLRPTKLNDALGGGVPRQCQVGIAARPDGCKTLTAVNIAGGAAADGYKVVYFANEDPPAMVMYRLVARLLKVPLKEIKKDLKGYYEKALAAGYGNIYLIPMHPGTITEIRQWVEKIKPDIVIVDQIRNLKVKDDSMTVNLEQASIQTRNLAKEFDYLSIILTQAGEQAHNRLTFGYNEVDSSRTGFAGALDLFIAVGQNADFKAQGKVMLSFDKCKYWAPIAPFYAKVDYERQMLLA